jgi:alpha-beta hydrolase superfamily lysophospholipase
MNITTNDNLQLFTAAFEVPNAKGIVALVHGLGEHGGRYAHWAAYFNQSHYNVVTLDLRGHGRSEGKRGHTPTYEHLLDDIDVFLAKIKEKYPKTPIFLYGHSLGGGIVLNYLVRRQPTFLQGVIATGPFITLAFEPNKFTYALGKLMRNIFPSFTQNNQVNSNHVSRDKAVVTAYDNDPLVHSELSAALGIGALEAGKFLFHHKGNISTPTLLLHGGNDKLTNPEGTITFFNQTTGNRHLKIFTSLYHEIHNEPEKEAVFEYIIGWVNSVVKNEI